MLHRAGIYEYFKIFLLADNSDFNVKCDLTYGKSELWAIIIPKHIN